jgi:hypothetical protein
MSFKKCGYNISTWQMKHEETNNEIWGQINMTNSNQIIITRLNWMHPFLQ